MARPAPAAARAVDIVSFLTAHANRGFTLSELVTHLKMNVASAHATLAVLSDAGFVVRDPFHRTYVLGPALAAVGFATMQQHPSIAAAIEQAERLSDELDRPTLLMARAGRDVIFVASRGPDAAGLVPRYPGEKAPLMAPFGAIFTAWGEPADIDQWLARAAVGPELAKYYRKVLAEIRGHGYAVPLHGMGDRAVAEGLDRLGADPVASEAERNLATVLHQTDEHLFLLDSVADNDLIAVQTIVAPIFDAAGRVQLALGVSGDMDSMRALTMQRLARRVVRAATVVTKRTGGVLSGQITRV